MCITRRVLNTCLIAPIPSPVSDRMCKPIEHGVTVYPLVFSKSTYLYKWRWFLGKGANSRAAPHGQPTDTQTLDEDSEEQTGFIMDMICNNRVGKEFDNTGAVGYFDKAFSSIKLFAKLAARSVRAVGMLGAKRPKKMERGPRWYWPFHSYAKEEVEDLEPGWRRAAYTQLPSGQWLAAEACRDNRLVTMISLPHLPQRRSSDGHARCVSASRANAACH